MSQVMINFRQDEDVKSGMESICRELGFSPSVAYNMFARKVVRERRIPFDLALDPFYSDENISAIRDSLNQIREGRVVEKTLTELEAMEDT